MTKRPISVSIICWISITLCTVQLAFNIYGYGNPEVIRIMQLNSISVGLQYFFIFTTSFVIICSSIMMLAQKKAGRTVFIFCYGFMAIFSLIINFEKSLNYPALLFAALFAFLLYRPKANLYFNRLEK